MTFYRAAIEYSYEVGGMRYRSKRIYFFDFGSSDPTRANRTRTLVKEDGRIQVFYDPANPASAVLDRRISPVILFLFFFGAFAIVLPLLVIHLLAAH